MIVIHEDLGLNSVDTESTALGDCQFLTYAIIRASVWSDDCTDKKVIVTKCC